MFLGKSKRPVEMAVEGEIEEDPLEPYSEATVVLVLEDGKLVQETVQGGSVEDWLDVGFVDGPTRCEEGDGTVRLPSFLPPRLEIIDG